MKILLKDAKNILALEEKAKLEGKDALDVVDDKNSLFRPGIFEQYFHFIFRYRMKMRKNQDQRWRRSFSPLTQLIDKKIKCYLKESQKHVLYCKNINTYVIVQSTSIYSAMGYGNIF